MEGFDFARWRAWVEAKGRELQVAVPTVKFGSNDEFLPSFGLDLENDTVLGSFRCWSNGLVDFDIHDLRSKTPKLVKLKMMIEVSDDNFEATFKAFEAEFEKVN